MSREILFRGKRKDNGEWVEGYYEELPAYDGTTTPKIVTPAKDTDDYNRWSFVLPDTVGEYTGLRDKNGRKIFEGDIVDILTENEEIGVIKWDNDTARFVIESDGFFSDFDNYYGTDLEIIGNIYDNPELLEEE